VGIGGGALVGAVLFERIGVQSLPFVYAVVLIAVAAVLIADAVRRTRVTEAAVSVR
jgi:MFS transporter, DHA1 family, inner membrane transport protein